MFQQPLSPYSRLHCFLGCTSLHYLLIFQLSTWGGLKQASRGENGLHHQLTRLRYFVAHVRRTVERMEQARTGQHRYSMEQLDMLDVRDCCRVSRMYFSPYKYCLLVRTKGAVVCNEPQLPHPKKSERLASSHAEGFKTAATYQLTIQWTVCC